MIGPLLRVAASAVAARSLRMAAHDAATRTLLTLGAGVAIAVGALCLSYAALVLLARNMDPAGAWIGPPRAIFERDAIDARPVRRP